MVIERNTNMRFLLKVLALICLIVVSKISDDQGLSRHTAVKQNVAPAKVFSQNFQPATYIIQNPRVSAFDEGSLKLN